MQQQITIIFIDLDNFKPINDIFGYYIGDGVLKETSQWMVQKIRASDIVARCL
jgi:diguanylate cyclase (GGDEF)-like protein